MTGLRTPLLPVACALALSACGPSLTGVYGDPAPDLFAPGATARLAPDDDRRVGIDLSVRLYQPADSLALVGHANLLFNIVGPVYALAGTGWGSDPIDRSWEAGLGAQFDVADSPTGPIAIFAELGATFLEGPPPEDPLGPASSISGGFVRVGLSWCFTIRIDC